MKKKFTYIAAIFMAALLAVTSLLPAGAVNNEINFETKTDTLYLLNLDTDTVVYKKAESERRYPASTTKIMTYIVVYEQVQNLETTMVPIKQNVLDELLGTGSSIAGLEDYVGKELSVLDLLYCMMVSSGNDAALVLADYLSEGNVDNFVKLMNNKAKELGCKDTNFTNPHGLHDENQYTTAVDLAKITKCAVTLKYFTEICDTVTYYLDGEDENPLVTTNRVINPNYEDYYYEYAKGIKTGTTDEAGHCLVSSALKDGETYICVALKAPCYDADGNELEENYAMIDTKNLYEWAFENIDMKTIVGAQTNVCDIKINYASGRDKIMLVPEYSYSTMLPKDLDESEIKINTYCPDSIDTPVQKGDIVGTATITYKGEELTKMNIVASETVERSDFIYAMTIARNIVTSSVFLIAISVILLLFIAYMIMISRYNKKQKTKINNQREM